MRSPIPRTSWAKSVKMSRGSRLDHLRLHARPVYEGHRLVVTDDRPVDGQLQCHGLPTDRREHRLAADSGFIGDCVDGRRSVAALDEQPGSRAHHELPRCTGLLLAEGRAVVPLD